MYQQLFSFRHSELTGFWKQEHVFPVPAYMPMHRLHKLFPENFTYCRSRYKISHHASPLSLPQSASAPSMTIDDFDRLKIILSFDRKANPILIIDTNAVLSLPVSMQRFQMICGWYFQILQTSCIIDHNQFSYYTISGIFPVLPLHQLLF